MGTLRPPVVPGAQGPAPLLGTRLGWLLRGQPPDEEAWLITVNGHGCVGSILSRS